MTTSVGIIGDWGHVFAAALFAALAIWIARRMHSTLRGKAMVAALSLTAIWSLSTAFISVTTVQTGLIESLRNCAWLTVLIACLRDHDTDKSVPRTGLMVIYGVLLATLGMQILLDMMLPAISKGHVRAIIETSLLLRLIWTIGALLLIQHIMLATRVGERGRMAPVCVAAGAMWLYDLILYTGGYVGADWVPVLFAVRGLIMACIAPVLALSVLTVQGNVVQLSRQMTLGGLGLIASLGVGIVPLAIVAMVQQIDSEATRLISTGAVFALMVGALVVLPSPRFRSLIRVLVAKHLFQHRYDYRAQWMAFADTIGSADAAAPIYERAIKAVADITESPGGMLLLRDQDETLAVHSAWNWPGAIPLGEKLESPLVEAMARDGWVIDVDRVRSGQEGLSAVPGWLTADLAAWALVPIFHFDQLSGALLLARPPLSRPLDWEDYDMLRTAGRQVASYIAEAGIQQVLAEAQRFDEFNRRFAFIMHDIKNLVSQLSLLARNARRHADNPDFRTDMILTLEESVGKMNDMLARLSQHNNGGTRLPVDFTLSEIAQTARRIKGSAYPLLIDGDMGLRAHADPGRVEQIVMHLVQNAIEASRSTTGSESPIHLNIMADGEYACLSIADRGCGMSPEFVRNELFRPFASSKAGGFGLGAFEARELARAMGGRLDVDSQLGKGSRFLLRLPLATADPVESHDANGKAA